MRQSKVCILIVGLFVQEATSMAGPVLSKKIKEGFQQGFGLVFNILQDGMIKPFDKRSDLITTNDYHHNVRQAKQTIIQVETVCSREDYDIDLAIRRSLSLSLDNEPIKAAETFAFDCSYSIESLKKAKKLELAQAIKYGMPELEYTEEAKEWFFLQYKKELLFKAQEHASKAQEKRALNKQVAQWYKHHSIPQY